MDGTGTNNEFDKFFVYVKQNDDDKKPSDKDRKQARIKSFLSEGEELAARHESFRQDVVLRGNKALYEQLASIYGFALRVNEDKQRDEVIEGMRVALRNGHEVKTTAKTPFMTVVVKYIVKADRQTAFNYSRALQVAFAEDVKVGDLANYLEQRGGVLNVGKTKAEEAKELVLKREKTRRLAAWRKALLAEARHQSIPLSNVGGVTQIRIDRAGANKRKETSKETSDFAIIFSVFDPCKKAYYLAGAFDMGYPLEEKLLAHMVDRMPVGTEALERYASEAAAKVPMVNVLDDGTVHEPTRPEMQAVA